MKTKYKAKKVTNLVYYSLILFVLLLTILRWVSAFNGDFVVINEEINSHTSNFSLSLLVYVAIGFTWLLQGNSFTHVIMLGIAVMGANLVCETMMDFLNTADIVDAIYGLAGTLIGFCFLYWTNTYGLIKENQKE